MILRIPVRPAVVKVNGANRDVIEIVPGFCNVIADDGSTVNPSGTAFGDDNEISNPLIEAFLMIQNSTVQLFGVNERLFIELAPQQFSNPGIDDQRASLHDNQASIV